MFYFSGHFSHIYNNDLDYYCYYYLLIILCGKWPLCECVCVCPFPIYNNIVHHKLSDGSLPNRWLVRGTVQSDIRYFFVDSTLMSAVVSCSRPPDTRRRGNHWEPGASHPDLCFPEVSARRWHRYNLTPPPPPFPITSLSTNPTPGCSFVLMPGSLNFHSPRWRLEWLEDCGT